MKFPTIKKEKLYRSEIKLNLVQSVYGKKVKNSLKSVFINIVSTM